MYYQDRIKVCPASRTRQHATRTVMLVGFLMIASQVIAQISQPRRYEATHKQSDDQYTIISLKEEGLALFHDINKYKDGNKELEA